MRRSNADTNSVTWPCISLRAPTPSSTSSSLLQSSINQPVESSMAPPHPRSRTHQAQHTVHNTRTSGTPRHNNTPQRITPRHDDNTAQQHIACITTTAHRWLHPHTIAGVSVSVSVNVTDWARCSTRAAAAWCTLHAAPRSRQWATHVSRMRPSSESMDVSVGSRSTELTNCGATAKHTQGTRRHAGTHTPCE